MNCRNYKQELSAYLDGELPDAKARAVAEHVAGCESCRRELEQLRRLSAGIAKLPGIETPPQFLADVKHRIAVAGEGTGRGWFDALFRPVWWKVPLEAVAVVAVLVTATVLLRPAMDRQSQEPLGKTETAARELAKASLPGNELIETKTDKLAGGPRSPVSAADAPVVNATKVGEVAGEKKPRSGLELARDQDDGSVADMTAPVVVAAEPTSRLGPAVENAPLASSAPVPGAVGYSSWSRKDAVPAKDRVEVGTDGAGFGGGGGKRAPSALKVVDENGAVDRVKELATKYDGRVLPVKEKGRLQVELPAASADGFRQEILAMTDGRQRAFRGGVARSKGGGADVLMAREVRSEGGPSGNLAAAVALAPAPVPVTSPPAASAVAAEETVSTLVGGGAVLGMEKSAASFAETKSVLTDKDARVETVIVEIELSPAP